MKKRMLALAAALLLLVTCFAVYPVSAAEDNSLAVTIKTSQATITPGDKGINLGTVENPDWQGVPFTVSVTAPTNGEYKLAGFLFNVILEEGYTFKKFTVPDTIIIGDPDDPDDDIPVSGGYEGVFTSDLPGLATNFSTVDGKTVLHFEYDGANYSTMSDIALVAGQKKDLFTFYLTVPNAETTTPVKPVAATSTLQFAYESNSTYSLYDSVLQVTPIEIKTPAPAGLESTYYTVDNINFYIRGIAPGTTKETFLANVTGDDANTVVSSDIIGTGTTITVGSKTYTAIVLADANGDGVVNSSDLQRIFEHINESNPLTGVAALSAADANKDGLVNSSDLQRIFEHINESNPLNFSL